MQPFSLSITNFIAFQRIFALILREMSTTYGRNPGGYIWAILEPVLGIGLLTAIFGLAFATPALGVNFPIFYATGLLPFLMFTDITAKLAQAINFSKPLLTYPVVNVYDSLIARFLLASLTQLLVSYILLFGIMYFFDTQLHPDMRLVAISFAVMLIFSLSVGVLNCFLTTMFPVYQRIWSILMRPMFLLCGIIFLFEAVPQPFRDYLWFNPLMHIVAMVRRAFYESYDAPWISIHYVLFCSLVCLVLGLALLKRYDRYLINET